MQIRHTEDYGVHFPKYSSQDMEHVTETESISDDYFFAELKPSDSLQ